MRVNRWAVATCMLLSWSAFAQLKDIDPDWKDGEAVVPPAFHADRAIALDMPRHVTLRIGVDPQSLRVTQDGVVRYVVVATSPGGSVNASYEGIRCVTGEVKVYARYSSDGSWRPVTNPDWKPLNGNQPSLHALAFARQGACEGRAATAGSVANIVSKLKSPSRDPVRH